MKQNECMYDLWRKSKQFKTFYLRHISLNFGSISGCGNVEYNQRKIDFDVIKKCRKSTKLHCTVADCTK